MFCNFFKFSFNFFHLLILAFVLISVSCSDNSTNTNSDNLEWNKKITKTAVHNQATLISEFIKDFANDSDKINFIRKSIDSIRFFEDKSGYFYVYDFKCVNIAHAIQKELQGTDLSKFLDSHGDTVVKKLSKVAQNGGGFVEFYWIKSGETGEKKKLGYVEPIPNTNYFIGSGVYLE